MATLDMQVRGVNLGGWLVIERWITPELFSGTNAYDEYSLSEVPHAEKLIDKHRREFIKGEDFRWLADNGFGYIRIPIGYWILEKSKPYLNGQKYLDFAFSEAKNNNLKILLDLHGLPGSQNGKHHSGRAGEVGWHLSTDNIEASLEFLASICARYGKHKSLWGIEFVNEPDDSIPLAVLVDYYAKAIKILNQNCPDNVAAIASDSFRPIAMAKAINKAGIKGLILDIHFYQTHSLMDKLLGFSRNLAKVRKWKRIIRKTKRYNPVIIGEWSGGLGINKRELSKSGKQRITSIYIKAQQEAYDNSDGWFYWNYKVDTKEQLNPWDLKTMVDNKLLIL
jgi:glucan 1,3-beta-glucosidase